MIWSSSEIVSVLIFLLPGFVAAAVFYSLTSHPKPNEFGSVVQALVFTIVVQAIAVLLRFSLWTRQVEPEIEVLISVVVAIVVGLLVALVSNRDTFHNLLRFVGITRETSHPSEWYSAFAQHEHYVVLHMSGERRLYGWPSEWPSNPDRGHFRITDGEWLSKLEYKQTEDTRDTSKALELLVPVSEVEMVEFVTDATETD